MESSTHAVSVRLRAAFAASALVVSAAAAVLISAPAAHADTAPPPGTPATVSADALPTVQQNGVIWSEVTVGNTVYATGSFSQTWPAGTTQSAGPLTPRSNLLAFDITTGNLITSFNHSLNAQGLVVTASPDGSRVYVGGDFTTVDGVTRNHIAAFDTATGALDANFHPSVASQVAGIAPTNTTVYAGGNFFSVNGVARTRLAAFNSSNGALLSWAPTADDNFISAMVMAPDHSRVIVGGRFTTLNGVNAYGLGAVDATTGATLPFAINQSIQDYGSKCGILSLSVDANQIYGSGFAFGCGNFEGTFAADPDTGNISWINDCHGDTYGTFPVGQVLYSVSHAHECSAIGQFPDTNPRVWHHALASTTYPTGTNVGPDDYGWNYNGIADSSLLHWYPALGLGTYTGQSQAAWAVTGNSQYVALGGEFPTANGKAQQGIVRYAITSIAPNKVGPVATSTITPTVVSLSSGTARLAWTATWDYDNANLTYNVLRDGSATPIATLTQTSNFWQLPSMGYIDTGLTPGSTHTYRIQVVDPSGNKIGSSTSNTVTITSAVQSQYATDVVADGASNYWRLGEPSGTTGYDWAGFSDLVEGSGVSHGVSGAIGGDTNAASGFDGTSNGNAATTTAIAGPNTFSIESWINTTTSSGGKIVGFGDQPLGGTSSNYDRHIYMDNAGHIIFGVYNNGAYTVTSSKSYNDGQWHQIVATMSSTGLVLYIDGKKIGQNQGTSIGQPFNGYWRIGGDNLNGWPSQPSSSNFQGSIDDVAIYPTAVALSVVQKHFIDSGRTLNIPTAPADNYGKTIFNAGPDLYWRMNDASGPTAADASVNGSTGIYSASGVSYGTPSPISGAGGTAVTFDGSSGTMGSTQQYVGPSVYSEELWFKTTTTHGGKLIGFGDQQTALSGNYDRHVYMLDSGQLVFGAWTGQENLAQSTGSYNDGSWHYLVATQGPDGMTLYVDGSAVATNPQTSQQAYSGYWRVGGDTSWGGDGPYFSGSIDEVAIYSSELTAGQVQAHYHASPAAVNQPPTAAFTPTCTNLVCSFDASASNDPDGSIASYAWDFGDGSTGTGVSPSHTYAGAGSPVVTLTVTDNSGATNSVSHSVTVSSAPNQPPTAAFTPTCTNLVCSFDASASNDPDGSIASYAWDFGDGSTGTGVSPSHTYAGAGSPVVTLTVTDNSGATNSISHTMTVTANQPPTAAFTPTCTYLTCSFDASASNDPDGSIASYAWDFGDGSTGTGVSPSHTYAGAGSPVVTLTVTDNGGATNSVNHTVTVTTPPANQPPNAAFTPTCTNLSCTFDASASNDPDGSIASYAWDFGDGSSGTGVSPTHAYPAAGDYTVKLTVTDNGGATGSTTNVISPRPPANAVGPAFASDAFNRTLTNGWGNADTGGAWTAVGNKANLSVSGGSGILTMPATAAAPGALLNSVSATSSDTTVVYSTNKLATGGGIYLYVVGRHVSTNNEYRARIRILSNNTIAVALTKLANSATETVIGSELTLPGVTYAAGMMLKVRSQVTGTNPTTIRLKVWPSTQTEPTAWTLSNTDSTSGLQAAGSVGLEGYLSGSATNAPVAITAASFASSTILAPPTAAFSASCVGLTCSTDASGSSDPSGTISSYTWSWGDGVVTTGQTASHTFAGAGSYRITLTVTDGSGWTDVITRSVTVP